MGRKTGSKILITTFVVALKEKTGDLVSISLNLCKIGKFLCHHITRKPAVFPPAYQGKHFFKYKYIV